MVYKKDLQENDNALFYLKKDELAYVAFQNEKNTFRLHELQLQDILENGSDLKRIISGPISKIEENPEGIM